MHQTFKCTSIEEKYREVRYLKSTGATIISSSFDGEHHKINYISLEL